ncbi:MAG TPA: FliM/FliN family flagellar motor switch protein, partial [Acetobacteraceae bacterium]|nr:FliM/FliN family flagellar motor switch protein [Acetobacteraceae bacterium]
EPLSPVNFRFERLEVNPRFVTISRPSNAAIRVGLRVDMDDCGGRIELLLPYTTLEPVRDLLLQQFMGEKFGHDFTWETHFAEELRNTELELNVLLDERVMRLADIMRLNVGDSIILAAEPGAPVKMRCGTTPLFEGRLGQSKNHLAIQLETKLFHSREEVQAQE